MLDDVFECEAIETFSRDIDDIRFTRFDPDTLIPENINLYRRRPHAFVVHGTYRITSHAEALPTIKS